MTGKIKRRSLRCGGRPKADFGSIFTTFIAPALGVAGSVADSAISKTQVSKSNTKPAVKDTNTEVTNNNTSVENLPTIQVPTKEPISGLVTSNTVIPPDPTKTPAMRLGGRKKCWIGAAIMGATSIAGSLFGAAAQKREMRRQKNIQDWQNTTQEAANMTTALNNSQDYQEDYLRQFRTAARLGKTLGAKGIYITDGGDATKIGSNTYLLRGGSHEDVNETGQTGIGINVGGNEVEAEGGEVAQKKNGALRIFSAQPILGNGMSPAQAILRGYNKDKVFSQQQAFKKRNGLKDDGSKLRNGGLTSKDRGSSKHPYPSVSSKDFAGGGRSYPIPTKADAVDALRLAGLHGRSDVRSKVYSKYPSLRPKAAFGDWVKTNRDDNALADLLYESGLFDRESWNTMLRDIHEFTGMGANPYNTDDNIDAVMAPAFGVPNQAQIIRNVQQANKLMQAAKASQTAQRTAYAAKEAKDFYRGLGINIPVGRNQIYNPTFRSSEIASKIKDSNNALRIYLNNTHLPKGIRLTPVNQDNISRSAARVINPREAEIVRMGIPIGQSAKNMTNGANPFLYTSRNSNEVLEGLSRVIASAKQGAKSVGQRVGNNRAVREFRNLSNKDKAKSRAAGRSQFIYRAGKYNNYSTIKETNAKKERLNRIVGARRVAKALGGYSRPVEGMRPKAGTGMYIPFNKRYTSIYDAPDYDYDYNGGNVLGNNEVTVTAKRIKPTFMKPNNDAMNLIKVPKEEVPYIPQHHNRSRTIFSGGDYLGLGIDTLAALSTGLVNYNTASKYTLPDRAPIIQASKLPTTYNVNPEIEEVKRYRDRLTGQTFNNTSSSVAALNRSSAINLDALSNLSKLWATKENEENKMLTEDAKNQQTVAAQNVQNELARQSEIARIKNEATQAKGDALNVGLSGLSQAWTNFWTAGRTAYEDDQSRRAMIASSKEATPTRLSEMDFDLSPDILASLYRTAKDDRTKRFYLSRLSPKQRLNYGIN